MIIIRTASPKDIPAITRLCSQLNYPSNLEDIKKRFKQISKDSNHKIFVAATNEKEVIGWVHVIPRILLMTEPLAEIGGLVMDQKCRRKGIAKQLMDHVNEWAKENHYHGIIIRSSTQREESHIFYPKAGYKYLKDQKVYYREIE